MASIPDTEVVDAAELDDIRAMHPMYLPFTEMQLAQRFAPVAANEGEAARQARIAYYRDRITRGDLEKDERFWTAAALMAVFHASDRQAVICALLRRCLGETPPFVGKASWEECYGAESTELFFEVGLPAPALYQDWLRANIEDRQIIPSLRARATEVPHLEGRAHLDAMLIDGKTGCAVLIEAKVTSDCSCLVSYDLMRNQLARNIDAMLDANPQLQPPLNARRPELSAFVMLTPRLFKENPYTRFYGRLMQEYQASPSAIHRDLPHRAQEITDYHHTISRRIGWLTFEAIADAVPAACSWLDAT